MRSQMTLQKPRSRERLAAKFALAHLVVGPHVHRIGWHRHIDLFAGGTLLGLLVIERPRK